MYFSSEKSAKIIFAFGVLAFFFVGFLGLTNFGMDMGMSYCPFADGMSVCNMNPFEYITAWQNMFTSLPQQQSLGLLLLVVLALFIGIGRIYRIYLPSKNLSRQFSYSHRQKYILTNSFLQDAFSNGILNPKLY
ncbi:MAG: hypothetical protein AAB757_03205 [Patescibacteria group bacterium]